MQRAVQMHGAYKAGDIVRTVSGQRNQIVKLDFYDTKWQDWGVTDIKNNNDTWMTHEHTFSRVTEAEILAYRVA